MSLHCLYVPESLEPSRRHCDPGRQQNIINVYIVFFIQVPSGCGATGAKVGVPGRLSAALRQRRAARAAAACSATTTGLYFFLQYFSRVIDGVLVF